MMSENKELSHEQDRYKEAVSKIIDALKGLNRQGAIMALQEATSYVDNRSIVQ